MSSTPSRPNLSSRRSGTLLRAMRGLIGHPMFKGTGQLLVAQYVSAGVSMIATLVAARLLGPASYGKVAMLMAFPILVGSFFGLKSASISIRYMSRFRGEGRLEHLRGICKLGYLVDAMGAVLAFIVVAAISPFITSQLLNLPGTAWLTAMYAASLVFYSPTGSSGAVLTSLRRFGWLAVLSVLEKGITLLLVIGFLVAGRGVAGMMVAVTLSNVIAGIVAVVVATRALNEEGVPSWWRGSLGTIAPLKKELRSSFGWHFVTVTVAGLMGQLPLLLLGKLRDPKEAGLYRVATSILALGSFFEGALGRVAYPVLSARWGTGERQSLRLSLRRWTLYGGIPLGLLVLAMMPLLPVLVPAILGTAYQPMVSGAQLLLIGAAVSVTFFYLNQLFYSAGRMELWAKAYLIESVLVIGLALIVIPKWGFTGMAGLIGLGTALFNVAMAAVSMGIWSPPRPDEQPDLRFN